MQTNQNEKTLSQFAAEKARMVSGQHRKFDAGNDRFTRLAGALIAVRALCDGESEAISFARLNEAMGANRKVGPEGVASWRTLLQRAVGVVELPRYSIDTEKGAVVVYRD